MTDSKIIHYVSGKVMPFSEDDVDTDIIIPSGYLRAVTWDDVAKGLLMPRRIGSDGEKLETVLNDPRYAGASILLGGSSFGCGSSREHAPQAIKRSGYNAIVAVSYAGIFGDNCFAIGLPAVSIGRTDMNYLLAIVEEDPTIEIMIDMHTKKILPSKSEVSLDFDIEEGHRQGFISGTWDEKDKLARNMAAVTHIMENSPCYNGYENL